ncbi:MAG: hypothetical protein II567_12495 [Candidatus Riflebacteria bacterium]|nr:hypothetical protein [Candidatus Riflebacteria bacterium]
MEALGTSPFSKGNGCFSSQGDFREDFCKAKLGVFIVIKDIRYKNSYVSIYGLVSQFIVLYLTIKTKEAKLLKTNYNKNASL